MMYSFCYANAVTKIGEVETFNKCGLGCQALLGVNYTFTARSS